MLISQTCSYSHINSFMNAVFWFLSLWFMAECSFFYVYSALICSHCSLPRPACHKYCNKILRSHCLFFFLHSILKGTFILAWTDAIFTHHNGTRGTVYNLYNLMLHLEFYIYNIMRQMCLGTEVLIYFLL